MYSKPTIGITKPDNEDLFAFLAIWMSVKLAGGSPLVLTPSEDYKNANIDGLILGGGKDVFVHVTAVREAGLETLEENQASKKLIIELLKENEKIKLEKQMMTNQILENENKELLEQLMGSNAGNKPSRIFLLIFGTIFGIGVLGSAKIITVSTAYIYNRIMYRPVRA